MKQSNKCVGVQTPTLTYNGQITVKYKDKFGKERIMIHHNSGDTGLYSLICRTLAGLPVTDYLPTALMAYTGSGGSGNYSYLGGQKLTVVCYDQSLPHIWKISHRKAYCDNDASELCTGTVQPNISLALFSRKNAGDIYNDGGEHTIYYAKIYDSDDELLFNGVPAKRTSDDTLGIYDFISEAFLENQGTGEFTAGPAAETLTVPIGYLQLDWLKSDSDCAIDTGLIPTLDYGVEVKAVKAAGNSLFGSNSPLGAYSFTGSVKSKALIQSITYSSTPTTYGEVNGTWQSDIILPSKIRYLFIIPSQLILNPSIPMTEFTFSNNLGTVCARVTLDRDEWIEPEAGANIILYWEMSFENGDDVGIPNVICRTLISLPVDKYLPRKIMAYNGEGALKTRALNMLVPYMTTPVLFGLINGAWTKDEINGVKIRYSFIIPNQLIMWPSDPQELSDFAFTEFRMFNDLNVICNRVKFEEGSEINPDKGSNIALYWDMAFINGSFQ